MTLVKSTTKLADVKALIEGDGDYLRAMVESIVHASLEAEMSEAIGAEKGERAASRISYRSGLLPALSDHPGGHAGAEGAAGPGGQVFDRAVRALPAL